jgi:hypothetical protein
VPQPSLFRIEFWERLEALVLEVFIRALGYLEQEVELPRKEDSLNWKLLFYCRRANHELRQEGRGLPSPISYEARSQPVPDDPEGSSRLFNRPDFSCGMHDDLAADWQMSEVFFTVECKRLGSPMPASHVLNREYTVNGILRFKDHVIGYAAGVLSGAMVGYMQTLTPDEILAQVSSYAVERGLPPIQPCPAGWTPNGVTRLVAHCFARENNPSPFTVHHLWLNLTHRKFVNISTKKSNKPKPLKNRPPKANKGASAKARAKKAPATKKGAVSKKTGARKGDGTE